MKIDWIRISATKTTPETLIAKIGDYRVCIQHVRYNEWEWSTNRTGEWGKPVTVLGVYDAMNAAIHEARSWSID